MRGRGTLLLQKAMQERAWYINDTKCLRRELLCIPDWHVEDVGFSFHNSLAQWSEGVPGRAGEHSQDFAGIYWAETSTLLLKNGWVTPGLVSHEVGHHMISWLGDHAGINFWCGIIDAYQKYLALPPGPSWLLTPGGRWTEFFADMYMHFVAEDHGWWRQTRRRGLIRASTHEKVIAWYKEHFLTVTTWVEGLLNEPPPV